MVISLKRLALTVSVFVVGQTPLAMAQQNIIYYAGQSSTGQSVVLDTSSIYASGDILEEGSYHANFVYFLDGERLPSQANCKGEYTWRVRGEGPIYSPESQATQNMINSVCGPLMSYVSMFDPDRSMEPVVPRVAVLKESLSEVRNAPGGDILCSVEGRSFINVHGHLDGWYSTDICRGRMGVVHSSQINYLEPDEVQWEDIRFYTPSSPLI